MIIILSLTFCLTLFSCSESNSPAQKTEVTTQVKESGWLEKEPEEISEYAEDYELDLSKLSVNSNYGSYDTQTHILNVSEKWIVNLQYHIFYKNILFFKALYYNYSVGIDGFH